MSGSSSHGHHHHCHLCAGSQEPKFSPSHFTSSSQQPCPSSHFQVGNQASELKGLQSHTAASGGRLHTPGTWHHKSAPARYHSVRSGNYVNVCGCFPQNHYNKKSGAWEGLALVLLETTKETSWPAADPPVLTGCRLRRNGHSTVRSSPAKSL